MRSARFSRDSVRVARDRGVGYLLKERIADLATFIADLRRVLDGGTVLDPVVVATDRPEQREPPRVLAVVRYLSR